MKQDRTKAITSTVLKMRPLLMNQFGRPIKELHRGVFPQGFIQVMFLLEKQPQPISMTDLALATCISKPNLTTVIDRLYTEGLAGRSSDENDRRVINVFLTTKGSAFLDMHRKNVLKLVEEKLSVLEDDDIEKLRHALTDMTEVLEKIEKKSEYNIK